jgi:uncharacterized protein (DUF2141 family)
MRKATCIGAALLLAAAAASGQLTASRGEITVIMDDFRTDAGYARVALFDAKEGFPYETEKARKVEFVKIKNYEARAVFTDIPYGTYAVAVLHDENANGEMDLNFFGVPTEGCGVSNNVPSTLSRPAFDDAKFKLDEERLPIHIFIQN